MAEFALVIPFFLTAGLGGVELANYSYETMLVSEAAAHVADNASRIGDYSKLQNRKIYESDVDDLMIGANLQAGSQIDLFNGGRVIISSLELNSASKPYIHWQRCVGTKRATSTYGVEGEVRSVGMGATGNEVYPVDSKDAVMFVEIQYDYKPLVSSAFVGTPTIAAVGSFTVRASRDLTQVYQTSPVSPKMTCDKYTATVA